PLLKMMQSMANQQQLKGLLNSPAVQEQLKKQGKSANPAAMQNALDSMKHMPTTSMTTETYSHITTGSPIALSTFSTRAPAGEQIQDLGGGAAPSPPVAPGKPAPQISVTGIDGVKRRLSDFRGKIVLIDFWATWCPPC